MSEDSKRLDWRDWNKGEDILMKALATMSCKLLVAMPW